MRRRCHKEQTTSGACQPFGRPGLKAHQQNGWPGPARETSVTGLVVLVCHLEARLVNAEDLKLTRDEIMWKIVRGVIGIIEQRSRNANRISAPCV